jgi:hypothetical protein
MAEEPKVHDEAPPGIGDHPFDPEGEWWSLCKHCGLARAAHFSATPESIATMQAHFRTLPRPNAEEMYERERHRMRYPTYVTPEGEHDNGRPKIGYVSDDEDE